jgi:hypothetical protein
MSDDFTTSNSLADLAARLKAEHGAVISALARGLTHAMAAGDILLEAKAQLKHGQWPGLFPISPAATCAPLRCERERFATSRAQTQWPAGRSVQNE